MGSRYEMTQPAHPDWRGTKEARQRETSTLGRPECSRNDKGAAKGDTC